MTDIKHIMPEYEAYKNSKVEWIGQIPALWKFVRIKSILLNGQKGIKIGPFGSALKSDLFKNTGFKVYGQEHAIAKNFNIGNKYIGNTDFKRLINYQIFPNDIIITMMGTTGKCKVVSEGIEPGIMDSHLIRLRVDETHLSPYYFELLINDSNYVHSQVKMNSKGSIMAGLNSSIIKSLNILLPSLQEQTAIAAFLDCKTAKIDQAITIKEKQINLLKERRQILIQTAVTQGLDPDAPMRDSGVEWIGKIPEHWEVKRIKNIFRLIVEPSEKNNNHELLSIYTDIGVKPRKDLKEKGNKASTTDGYWLVQKGDFIVNKLLAWMGAIGLSEYEGVTSPAYDILRPQKPINGMFYHFLFRTKKSSAEMKRHSKGIMEMRLRLYFDKFGVIEVPYPSKEEQDEIVTHINTQSSKIDKAITIQEQMIEKLKEYKTTLINSAVTGKIKVPMETK